MFLAVIQWVLMQQICETRSYFFVDTNINFLFRADHEQLRYEDSVLAQGALIQVQQWPQKIARAWNKNNRIAG
jgi:hypothetical protein